MTLRTSIESPWLPSAKRVDNSIPPFKNPSDPTLYPPYVNDPWAGMSADKHGQPLAPADAVQAEAGAPDEAHPVRKPQPVEEGEDLAKRLGDDRRVRRPQEKKRPPTVDTRRAAPQRESNFEASCACASSRQLKSRSQST